MSEPGRSASDQPHWGALAGRLRLRPGRSPAVACERPMVRVALMNQLTEGRRALQVPDRLASVFTLGAAVQRSTARRAVRAALGQADGPAGLQAEAAALAAQTATDHLQRLALDLPVATGQPPSPGWLRDAPRPAALGPTAAGRGATGDAGGLARWLQDTVLGRPPAVWLAAWRAERGAWLTRWAQSQDHPVPRWLRRVQAPARALTWCSAALDVQDHGEAGWRRLAAALAPSVDESPPSGCNQSADFAEQPSWNGATAETGPWTRRGHGEEVQNAWERLGARLADLVRLALGEVPDCGACAPGPGEGLAWTEMSRGLLVHWVRLAPGAQAPEAARVACYRVLAPTEWNFHPQGALARCLADPAPDPLAVRLAAAALDPCVAFTLRSEGATENQHA